MTSGTGPMVGAPVHFDGTKAGTGPRGSAQVSGGERPNES
jgi:hypothetical protein